MPEKDKLETAAIGFDLAELMGEEALLTITAAYKAIYKAGIKKGMQLAAETATSAA